MEKASEGHGWAIGIDLGTANTRVAVWRNGQVEMIPDSDGRPLMPSCVAFTDRTRLLGSAAKGQAGSNSANTIYGVKPLLGRSFPGAAAADLQSRMKHCTCSVVTEEGGLPVLRIKHKGKRQKIAALEVYAMLLWRAKQNAEAYLDGPVKTALISVPTYFGSAERQCVRDAAVIAGVEEFRVISGVEAIATCYSFDSPKNEGHILVLDLGAAFFSAGLFDLSHGVVDTVALAGAECIGGEYFITRLQTHLLNEIKRKWKTDLSSDPRAMRRLRLASETAMRDLSSASVSEVNIDSLVEGRDFNTCISRARLEGLCLEIFRLTVSTLDWHFADSGVNKAAISEVVVAGGCSRIPGVQKVWADYLGRQTPLKLFHPDEAEARGLALYASVMWGVPKGVSPLPDRLLDMVILSAVPHSIGVQTVGGNMGNILKRNTSIPLRQTATWSLGELGVTSRQRMVRIFEGERSKTKDNRLFASLDAGRLGLQGRLDDPDSNIEIEISIDADVKIEFALRDVATGKRARWPRISSTPKEQREQYLAAAKRYAIEDELEAARIADRCALDSLLASLQQDQQDQTDRPHLPPYFPSQRRRELMAARVDIANWADENQDADDSEFRLKLKELEMISLELKKEDDKAQLERQNTTEPETGLRPRIDQLRDRLLSARQTPAVVELFDSVNLVAKWLGQNASAEDWEYRMKSKQLDSISANLDEELDRIEKSKSTNFSEPGDSSTPVLNQGARDQAADFITAVPSPRTPIATGSQRGDPEDDRAKDARAIPDSPETTDPRISKDEGLDWFFPESSTGPPLKYTDATFAEISTHLRDSGHQDWGDIPRIYTVLRLIGGLDLIQGFLEMRITDIWFPFSNDTLFADLLPHPFRDRFLDAQHAVLSKGLNFERGPDLLCRKHVHFSEDEPLPFIAVADLGQGTRGVSHKVMSLISRQEYVRKTFRRPTAVTRADLGNFFDQLNMVKDISHRHCVELIGSYTDPREFGLITRPVADCNLARYCELATSADQERTRAEHRRNIRGFFGCLAGTLAFLHRNGVAHQALQPQNILVKEDGRVLMADFGLARGWEFLEKGEEGLALAAAEHDRTWVYAPPEVAHGGARDGLADMWCLGCVFLEMATALGGMPISLMRDYFRGRTGGSELFRDNVGSVAGWADELRRFRGGGGDEDGVCMCWVGMTLRPRPSQRCDASELFESICAAVYDRDQTLFCGACCVGGVDERRSGSDGDDGSEWSAQAGGGGKWVEGDVWSDGEEYYS